MDELRRQNQPHSLPLHLREYLPQRTDGLRMRVADSDSFTLFFCAANGQFQLLADGAYIVNIIKKRHISKRATNPGPLRRIKRHCGSRRAAINKEKPARFE